MEDAGVKIDTYRMGEITARLADRVEELEAKAYELAGEEFMLGSTQQVARILFEKLELTPGRKGKTGYSTDTRVLRSIRGEHEIVAGDRGVARVLEAAEHLPRPAADADRRGRAPAHDLQPDRRRDRPALDDEPEPAGDPDPHRARPRDPLRLRRRAGLQAALGRLLAGRAAHPRARLRRAEAARGVRARRGHPRGDRRRGARQGSGDADEGRAQRRQDGQLRDHLRHLVVRALGEPRDPARARRRSTSTPTSRASRTCRTSSSGRSSRRSATAT